MKKEKAECCTDENDGEVAFSGLNVTTRTLSLYTKGFSLFLSNNLAVRRFMGSEKKN